MVRIDEPSHGIWIIPSLFLSLVGWDSAGAGVALVWLLLVSFFSVCWSVASDSLGGAAMTVLYPCSYVVVLSLLVDVDLGRGSRDVSMVIVSKISSTILVAVGGLEDGTQSLAKGILE